MRQAFTQIQVGLTTTSMTVNLKDILIGWHSMQANVHTQEILELGSGQALTRLMASVEM